MGRMLRPIVRGIVHYFDHNATTPLLPQAREVLLQTMDEAWQNPSSPYRDAARVHRRLQDARARIADWMGRAAEEVVFTSGATEANNAVIHWAWRVGGRTSLLVTSPTEHPSVLEALEELPADSIRRLDVDQDGRIAVAQCAELISNGEVALAACMAANNETGVLGPVADVGEICAGNNVPFLCDASQWIGRRPARELPRDAFVVGCAHKFGGPKGVGFLCVPASGRTFHGSRGGEQEHGHRAGTQNFPAVAAMVAALAMIEAQTETDRRKRVEWRDAFVARVAAGLPGVQVNGPGSDRLWNTVSLTMPRFENTRWVTRLDKLGFQVSTGSACATGSKAPSHVLAAMGRSADETRRTVRISAGWETTESDWRDLEQAMGQVWQELRQDETGAAGNVVSV